MSNVPDRRLELLERIVGDAGDLDTHRLCQESAAVTLVTGAGITLLMAELTSASLGATDALAARLAELQLELGEGPSIDAHAEDRPTGEADLAADGATRWLAFTPLAVAAGARAVFSFPTQVGAVRLGTLDLYRDRPGRLSDAAHRDALLLASIAAQVVLLVQGRAPPGTIAAELEANADLRSVVHQATGVVAAQLEVSVAEALIRLRAHAFSTGRPLHAVAQDVVERRLRLDAPAPPDEPPS